MTKNTKVESKLIREGGSHIDIGGTDYHFQPYDDGAHVADVADEAHADKFLSITEGFKLYRGDGKLIDKNSAPAVALSATAVAEAPVSAPLIAPAAAEFPAHMEICASLFPDSFTIHGQTHSLGAIATLALCATDRSTAFWNALEQEDRAALIEAELDKLEAQGENASPEASPPAATAPTPGEERAALADQYAALYGKPAHHKFDIAKLRALIDNFDSRTKTLHLSAKVQARNAAKDKQ